MHIAVAGVSVFLLLLVHRKVYEHFSTDSRYSIDIESLNIANAPDWLIDEQLKEHVGSELNYTVQTSVFDDTLIPNLRLHYQRSPWVKRIILIERRLPNDLKIKLELRRPYLAIMRSSPRRDDFYLIDKEFVRLPGQYNSLPGMPMPLPIITGVKQSPPLAGQVWKDKGLNAALEVVAILEENELLEVLQAKRIDVANVNRRVRSKESEVVIWTHDKARIEWGRAPDTKQYGELSIEEKIKNLKLVLEVCPELRGIKYAKIQFDQPYIALEDD